ncbi:sensor histidine kinase [Mucilaginibacter sp. 22184]|uniref:sensor histidine kinase n=1 Tax=Mucilaginibacter sp. 22184 TaxID=3453887 RepID=UPI003F85D9FC
MEVTKTVSWSTPDLDNLGFWSANLINGELELCAISKTKLGLSTFSPSNLETAFKKFSYKDRRCFLEQIKSASPHGPMFRHISAGSHDMPGPLLLKGQFKFNDSNEAIGLSGILSTISKSVKVTSNESDLLTILSHELKAPLTTIKLYIQLASKMLGKVRVASVLPYLDTAVREVDLLNNTMENLLDYSSLNTGDLPIYPQVFSLSAMVKEEFLKHQEIHGTHIFEYHDTGHIKVNADKIKIRLVINNLINNAIKYAPDQTLIRLSCNRVNDQAVECVQDHGPGISFEDQQKLFTKFSRVGGHEQITKSGHGVGLYLVRKITQAHHGEAWVKSQPGMGSAFYFCLPEQRLTTANFGIRPKLQTKRN